VLTSAETSISSTERNIMELHARLYPSDEYVKSVFPRVLEEVDLAEFMLKEVLGVSAREGVHRESLTFVGVRS